MFSDATFSYFCIIKEEIKKTFIMKICKTFVFALFTILFVGCLEDDEHKPQYFRIGTLHRDSGDNVYFITDTLKGQSELTLHITNKSFLKDVEDGYRFVMYYTVDKERNEKTFDVSYVSGVPIKNDRVYHVGVDVDLDTLGVDPVAMEFVYLSHNYLTTYFLISMQNTQKHHFYFSKDETKQKEDTVVLNFHHNANGDIGGHTYDGHITVPLFEFRDLSKDFVYIEVVSEVKEKKPESETFKYHYSRDSEPAE